MGTYERSKRGTAGCHAPIGMARARTLTCIIRGGFGQLFNAIIGCFALALVTHRALLLQHVYGVSEGKGVETYVRPGPAPDADVGRGEPSPGADVGGVGPARMQVRAE